jgi:hypothetical protein
MKLAELSPEVIEKIKTIRYDRILEKHEGPWSWDSEFQYGDPEFMIIQNRPVLLPIDRKYHTHITVLRVVVSENDKALTLFLKDTTYTSDPEWENFDAGRIAICENMPGQNFYITTVYHECFLVENKILAEP